MATRLIAVSLGLVCLFWHSPVGQAQTADHWTFDLSQDWEVKPVQSGTNTAKLMESVPVYPLDGSKGTSCILDQEVASYYNDAFAGMAPAVLRFPGGGDQSQMVHFGRGLSGYGFDVSPTGELYQFMVKKDPHEWARRRSEQMDLPADCSYLDQFLDLAKSNPDNRIVYTANVLTSDPWEQFQTLQRLIESGIPVLGVEMGNELYAFTAWDWTDRELRYWFNPEDGGKAAGDYIQSLLQPKTYCDSSGCFSMSFVSMVDSLESLYGIDLPLGITAAPPKLGNETVFIDSVLESRFVSWNDTLERFREEPWLDAYIVHLYARQLRLPCDALADHIEVDSIFSQADLAAAFECLQSSIQAYFGPNTLYPDGDNLRRHIKELVGRYASRTGKQNALWLTEWSWSTVERYNTSLMANTYLDAVFTQRWLHEIQALQTVLANTPPGLEITLVNRQLLSGTNENSIIGEFTELDKNYLPNPTLIGSPWGAGATKEPARIRRISYWPLAFFSELHKRIGLSAVTIDNLDPSDKLSLYGYQTAVPGTDSVQLDLFYTWSDSFSYGISWPDHSILPGPADSLLSLGTEVGIHWDIEWLSGNQLYDAAGFSKSAEITAIKNPASPTPTFAYSNKRQAQGSGNTISLPPYSFGHIRLVVNTKPNPVERHGHAGLWRVWPMPATNQVTLQAPSELRIQPFTASLLDNMGRSIRSYVIDAPNSSLDLTDLSPGVYYLTAAGPANWQPLRVVVAPR